MLRRRRWPILSLLVALASVPADAASPTAALRDASQLRSNRGDDVSRRRAASWRAAVPPVASRAMRVQAAALGRSWIAWDEVTGVPHRIVLADHPAPGVIASEERAAEHAQDLLARSLELLAPGTSVADFVLVSNVVSSGIRTVGFAQHHRGMPVVGGQLSFTFKHDRLLVIASDALPGIALPVRSRVVADEDARTVARSWIARDFAGAHAAGAADAPVVLPMFERDGVRYREVVRVPVDSDGPPSRWSVWLDAATGEPVARRQELLFEVAGVVYRVPRRWPGADYGDYGAPFVDVTVDQVPLVTDGAGVFNYDTTPGVASNAPVGPFVAVTNASGELATQQFQVVPGSGAVWTAPDDEMVEAQLAAFVHASVVKAHVRGVDPNLAWLDTQIPVTVNIDDQCNAFSDGNSINFYRASESCENTGRLADVVYHEFGHSVHHQSVIPGVGLFDTALSEGVSDYLAMTIIGDSGMGRGFFYDDTPLRELDPPDYEYRWPEDRGEVHDEGRIIAGALWDLRKALVAKHGEPTGVVLSDRIWYESTRRAVDIPSMYLQALVVDDDDGTLANGTPNGCEINAAYGPHGLFSAGDAAEQVTATNSGGAIRVELQLALPSFPACPVAAAPTMLWQLRGQNTGVTETSMSNEGGIWVAEIPAQLAGSVVQYQVHVNYDNGTPRSLPDNFVDPWYELFVGDTVPLYCTGFADGSDWAYDNDFEIGSPAGSPGNRDPLSSYDGDGVVLGAGLDTYGLYSSWTQSFAGSPAIATQGYTNVRLQYRRWLTVEDGFFDQAWITADGETVWNNFTSDNMDFATFHHVDREWRFHDVDISAQALDGSVVVAFQQASDGGLELGGWNVDQLCVVAFDPAAAVCGNGVLEASEGCDDGNVAAGDGCSDVCSLETIDEDTDGEEGSSEGGEGSDTDEPGLDGDGLIGRGCGCSSDGDRRGGAALFALVLVAYRRQRGATRRRLPSRDSVTSGASSSSRSQS